MVLPMRTGVPVLADTPVSELLEQWIGEQLRRGAEAFSTRPRIGVLAAAGTLRDGGWPVYGSDAPTVHAILEAGGLPCPIPALPLIEGYDPMQIFSDEHTFALLFDIFWPVVRSLDGLILCGGGDVSACLYGKPPHPQAETPDLWRDVWERYLARLAWVLCLPTLGICRGEPGRRLLDAVLSMHHQAVENLASGLEVAATAPDGVIEAFEDVSPARWWVATQFHPEWSTQLHWVMGLFTSFVDACRAFSVIPREETEPLRTEIQDWLRTLDGGLPSRILAPAAEVEISPPAKQTSTLLHPVKEAVS